ncbi:two-component system response regulator [Siphonobacter curvatus]|uniref:Two-component system response regulator n=2 Tax=Siphonobacter curvatus TaxID=2094562 RepID=A0A2S7IQJ6_9BACT|nr:two-component system response regulator [Siphonobacter curvatus]
MVLFYSQLMSIKPLFIVVEDDEDDRDLLQLACQEGEYNCELVFAEDGQHALEVLQSLKTRPSVMLLDINMPKMGGLALLEKLKNSSVWKEMPIVMLTTSDNEDTIHRAYGLGANSYIVKPTNFRGLSNLWDTVYHFWTDTVQLPVQAS